MVPLPGQDHASILAKIQNSLDDLSLADMDFKSRVDVIRDCAALDTDEHCRFVRDLCEIAGQSDPLPISYTTDGPLFAAIGSPIVILGPGLASQCHVPNEYVEIGQVEKAALLYGAIIRGMLL